MALLSLGMFCILIVITSSRASKLTGVAMAIGTIDWCNWGFYVYMGWY